MVTILRFDGPFVGLNLTDDPSQLGPGEATDCLNVRLDGGRLRKREGWTSKATMTGAILGLHDYLRSDTGAVLHLAKAGATLQKLADFSPTQIASGLSADEMADFETINNRAYLVDGTNLKVTDGTNVYDAQITRPSSAPTVATGDPGNLDGDYDYKVTFYSSSWGQESAASDVTSLVSPAQDKVDLASIPTSSDGRVDRRRIYRRKVSASGTTWHRVAEIADNTTTSYTDDLLDNSVDPIHTAPTGVFNAGDLPGFTMMAYQAGVLFLAPGDSTRLYFTRAGEPWYVDDYMHVPDEGDNELVMGLAAYQGMVVVFKEHSIWMLSGNTADAFFTRRQYAGVGCRSHHSIIQADKALYFLGEKSFYRFDGVNINDISDDQIRELVTNRNFDRDRYAVGIHDYKNSAIIWSFSSAGSSSNDITVAYYYANSRQRQKHSWAKWSMGTWTSAALLTDPTTRERLRIVGFSDGKLGRIYGEDDNSSSISFVWQTGKIDGQQPTWQKRWGELQVEVEPQTAGTLSLRYLLNADTESELGRQMAMTRAAHSLRLSRRARDLRLRFENSDANPVEIVSWRLHTEIAGRARS